MLFRKFDLAFELLCNSKLNKLPWERITLQLSVCLMFPGSLESFAAVHVFIDSSSSQNRQILWAPPYLQEDPQEEK